MRFNKWGFFLVFIFYSALSTIIFTTTTSGWDQFGIFIGSVILYTSLLPLLIVTNVIFDRAVVITEQEIYWVIGTQLVVILLNPNTTSIDKTGYFFTAGIAIYVVVLISSIIRGYVKGSVPEPFFSRLFLK